MKEDSIPICRSIQKHWIYKDAEHFKLWFEMLANARYGYTPLTDTYQGIIYTLNRGEFIFGRVSWGERLNIGQQKIRTFIKKLLKENMIEEVSKTNKFTIYRITNYENFNQQNNQQQDKENQGFNVDDSQQDNQQITSKQPADNQQITTKEERKEREEGKEIIILTANEEKFISVLRTIENYPVDMLKDKNLFNTLSERYPTLDLLQAIKDWSVYKEDTPLKPKCNARSQINTSFKKYVEWGKCLKSDSSASHKVDVKKTAKIINEPPENLKDWVD